MRSFDARIKRLREAVSGFSLVKLHYKDGMTRMVKPAEAVRQVLWSRENGISKISESTNQPGRFIEILQAVIDVNEDS